MRTSIRMRSFAGLAIGIAISSQVVWAQKTGRPPPTAGGNPSGSGTGRFHPNMTGRSDGPVTGSLNGHLYLTRNGMLDDGPPPPDPVTIDREGGGAPREKAYTDRKG